AEAVDARVEEDLALGGEGAPGDDLQARRVGDRHGVVDRTLALAGALLAQAEGLDVGGDDLEAEVDGGWDRLAQREAQPGEQAERECGLALADDHERSRVEARNHERAVVDLWRDEVGHERSGRLLARALGVL